MIKVLKQKFEYVDVHYEEIIKEHLEFTSHTFPKGTSVGALTHAKREIEEVLSDINTNAPIDNLTTEYADVLGCLFDSANRAGISPHKIFEAFYNKLQINKNRSWKDNGDGSYSHVKSGTTK